MWNYDRVLETGDLRYLLKLEDYDELPRIWVTPQRWEEIQQQVFDRIGMTDTAREGFDKLRRKIQLDLKELSMDEDDPKLSITRTRKKQTEQEEPITQQDLYDQVAMLRAFFHVDFDVKKMSVIEYYKQIQLYERHSREASERLSNR